MPPLPQQKRGGKGRVLSYTLVAVLVVLIAPTLVVFAFFHSLPESNLGEFKTRRTGGGSAGGGSARGAARRSLPSKQQAQEGQDAPPSRRTLIHNQKEAPSLTHDKQGSELQGAIIRGNDKGSSRGEGTAATDGKAFGTSRGGGAGGAGTGSVTDDAPTGAGIRHATGREEWARNQKKDGQQQQQQAEEHHFDQQQQLRAKQQRDEELKQRQVQLGSGQQAAQQQQAGQQRLGQAGQQQAGQAKAGQQQAGQANASQQQQAGQAKASQQPSGQQKAGTQQAPGQQKSGQQAQQRPRVAAEDAVLPEPLNGHWPNLLPQGKGTLVSRPNCADRQSAAQCKQWSADDGCERNPGFMYINCPASCGICTLKYLHGAEVPQVAQLVPGVMMPMVGYGTAGLTDITADAVFTAIRVGYRLVDSAGAREWYREDLVGWGWSASGIKREHLFITSKIHPRHLGYWSTLEVFNEALQDLQTDYVDLMLLHYPECWGGLCGDAKIEGTWQDSWAALEQLVSEKKLRAAGVSNFNLDQMAELIRIARIKPAVLQSNSDLLRQEWELQAFCRNHGIQFQAYSSLGGQWLVATQGQNPVLEHPVVYDIAVRLGKTTAQVVLRWALQHGQAVVPRTTKVNRMEANLDLFSFDLTDADMQRLDALDGSLQLQEAAA